MKEYGWLCCALEATVGVLIYYPIRALGEHMLVNPSGTPMQIWPLSSWFERGPSVLEILIVAISIWITAGILRARRKELFDK